MSCLVECRQHLQKKISNRKMEVFESDEASLLRMMKRTIEIGESDSILVVGPSRVGKTQMVQNVLNEIRNTKEYENRYTVVELYGLFHTNDDLAFEDIFRQMKVDGFKSSDKTHCASDVLSRVIHDLSTIDKNDFKSVIFVLEDFHCFCTRSYQNLLYILFDTAKDLKVPVFIVGITTHADALTLLEKRVKSRFSGNRINLFPKCRFEDRLLKFTELLTLEQDVCSDSVFINQWNKYVQKLTDKQTVIDVLRKLFSCSQREESFSKFLFYSISQISDQSPNLTSQHLQNAFEMLQGESKVTLLKSLSALQLCLVIAAHHHTDLFNGEPFNFEIIYERFHKFARNVVFFQAVSKLFAYNTYETLAKLELITPYSSTGSTVNSLEYGLYRLLVSGKDIRDAVQTYPNLSEDIKQWAEDELSQN